MNIYHVQYQQGTRRQYSPHEQEDIDTPNWKEAFITAWSEARVKDALLQLSPRVEMDTIKIQKVGKA